MTAALSAGARAVLRLRHAQLLINEMVRAKAFRVPIHLALGHEALAVALAAAMAPQDDLIAPHRNLHYNLALHPSLRDVVDEFLLRPTGLCGGRLGSMNLVNPAAGLLYSSSILGNNLPVAAGVALAARVADSGAATFVVTGDGAMEEGAFYETLLCAAAQDLALVVIVENNEWSLASRIDERRKPVDLRGLAASCGAAYDALSGNDLAPYEAALRAIRAACVRDNRPAVVEVALKTLGDWRMPTDEFPDGKYINYHAGPSPAVAPDPWPLLAEDESDPLHVLRGHAPEDALRAASAAMLAALRDEIA